MSNKFLETCKEFNVNPEDVPVVPDLHIKILKAINKPENTLDMGDWHGCETTHCRAGWTVHLAGKKGYALENKGVGRAAILITMKSCPFLEQNADEISSKFFVSNEEALQDIEEQASIEASLNYSNHVK